MMRLVFKAVVVVVLALGMGNYLVYLNTGKLPLSDWKDKLSLESLRFSPTQLFEDTKKATTNVVDEHFSGNEVPITTKIYKWTDENGVVHYGERPARADARELSVDDGNVTFMPATDVAETRSTQVPTETPQTPLEKARAAAEAMQKHHESQAGY